LKVFDVSLELSGDPKYYFGFTFNEFTKLDCHAFSLFEAVTSNFMVTTSSLNSTDVDPK